MNPATLQKESTSQRLFSDNDDYKICPYCGQNDTPFKLGVCKCGNQVGEIQYVKDPEKFARNYYSYVKTAKNKETDTAVKKTFAELEVFGYH